MACGFKKGDKVAITAGGRTVKYVFVRHEEKLAKQPDMALVVHKIGGKEGIVHTVRVETSWLTPRQERK